MPEDYISYIRSKVGQDKIFLNFAAGILCDEDGKVLLQLRGDSQTWGVIGGIMELGESSTDTVKWVSRQDLLDGKIDLADSMDEMFPIFFDQTSSELFYERNDNDDLVRKYF